MVKQGLSPLVFYFVGKLFSHPVCVFAKIATQLAYLFDPIGQGQRPLSR